MFNNLFNTKENYISGLNNELKTIFVYNKFINENKSILMVANTLFEANQFYKSLQNYTNDVLFFPMDDFLTSEALAISPELKNKRLETLYKLVNDNKKIVVTNLMGYLRYLPSKDVYEKSIVKLTKNEDKKREELISELNTLGYERTTTTTNTGEMSIHGYIVDIFPLLEEEPIRIEYWGDTIDSIRTYDKESQLTLKELDNVIISPISEFLASTEITPSHRELPNYISVKNIGDYLNDYITIYNEYSEIESSYKSLVEEMMEYSSSKELDLSTKYMFDLKEIKNKQEIFLTKYDNYKNVENTQSYLSYDIEPFPKKITEINQILNRYFKKYGTIIICLKNRYQINKIMDNIENSNFIITSEDNIYENKINLVIRPIEKGFIFNNLVVISDKELFNTDNSKIKYQSSYKYGKKIHDINKLNVGDYVVHNTHGIGKYLGIKTLEKDGLKKDYLVVEYRDADKLYIPVERIDLISKYSANSALEPRLNKLGGVEWSKTKQRIRKKLEDIAGELLELYAKREASVGFSFKKDDKYQIDCEKEFIYDDTLDQRKVTEEIKRDMESSHPMDRLLCGDVGYGKTEVAFRAMFKAVYSGKQVAYLCPTTILSNQHYQNAKERFKDFPVNIACLNRFVSTKEVKRIIEEIKEGKIDIVIGTHRLLSDDISFKDLGLLVIDEEQRFGVKHKEKIKQLKNNIDVLTLSATPIPRTLQMSMVGIRNLSLIETPPINRYPVQTYVLEENNSVIKDAIYKELSRDGQVFILYNHVDDLERKAKEIERLVPEARITFAHGRMDKNQLENVMMSFINKEYDILLCTTIIETGIDIPSVNTLIIMDADRFGLSQLYQIRGRVGRGNVIAYCYLMYKPGKVLKEIAEKRLQTIKEFTELGSGFAIAMRDLSIRGAGDILGSEQAGFIDAIGIELYLKMLNDEISRLKGIEIKEEQVKEQPLISVATSIDNDFVSEDDLKIEIHKKINEINSYETLDIVRKELTDRFGKLSDEIEIYMHEELFENMSKDLEIINVKQTKNSIELYMNKDSIKDGQKLFMETTKLSRMFRFRTQGSFLVITLDIIKLNKHYIYYLLDLLKILEKCK